MRIATMIISLILSGLIFLQGCTISALESVSESEDSVGGGGMLLGLMYLIGGAFVLPWPLFSTVVFALAGLIGIGGAAASDYDDLGVWGALALVLAAMSFLVGWASAEMQPDARLNVRPTSTGSSMFASLPLDRHRVAKQ